MQIDEQNELQKSNLPRDAEGNILQRFCMNAAH